MAATVATAPPAGVGISFRASTLPFPESPATEATRSTWWRPRTPSRSCRMAFLWKKPLRCFARALPRLTPSGIAAQGPVIWWPYKGLAGWATWGSSLPTSLDIRWQPSARGRDNAALARKLGAHHYIDSQASDPAEELQKLGGARVILATAPSGKSMTALIDGLGTDGKMVVVGASMDAIQVTPLQLIMARRSLQGWPSGTSADSEDTLNFSVLTGIRPMIEKFPLDRAPEAYERMISGKAEYRVVLTMPAA